MSKNKRIQHLIQLALFTGILIFLNVIGSLVHGKWDLTEEKRFTLTDSTREILNDIDEPVLVRVLLVGEFPAGFKRLQKSTQELLDDFRAEASSFSGRSTDKNFFQRIGDFFSFVSKDALLDYEFSDPNEGTTEEINLRRREMAKDGILPTRFRLEDVEGSEEKLIYPYAIFSYKGRQVVVNLLENQLGQGQEAVLANSIDLLEYKFANAIQKLMQARKPVIAFTTGHGELNELQTRDLVTTLNPYYEFGRFNLDSNFQVPPQIDMLIVAKPRGPFSDRDKFMIDQYVMNGGKVLWMVDRLNATLDSMRTDGNFVPRDYPTNLEDLLFRYGVRVEPNLVLDLQCSKIPQVVGMQGGNPQIEMFDWFYHPVITPPTTHPITKGLNNLVMFFPSKIDTIRTKTPVKKTVILSSSQYSREQYSPVRLNFEILRYDPDPSKFNKKNFPLAVLLEGEFPSLYENRVSENFLSGLQQIGQEYKSSSVPNRMMVIADGDIGANVVTNPNTGGIRALGFNPYNRQFYDNKDFLINAIEYLFDPEGVVEARGKEIKVRLLDTVTAKQSKTKWRLINLGIPLVFLGLFGLGFVYMRKRRFAG